MNKEQYKMLMDMGYARVCIHYAKKRINKDITEEQYDKAIQFWSEEFKKNSYNKENEKRPKKILSHCQATGESSEEEFSGQELINRLIQDFGGKADQLNNKNSHDGEKEIN